jgi:hypothetical protein
MKKPTARWVRSGTVWIRKPLILPHPWSVSPPPVQGRRRNHSSPPTPNTASSAVEGSGTAVT